MSDERSNRLGAYIRQRARPRQYRFASAAEKALPSLTEIGELSGLGKRRLDHKLAGRANWTKPQILAVCAVIGGESEAMLQAWEFDGNARGKPGNPNGWRQVHASREKDSSKPEKRLDGSSQP